jgi:hypothetical protein
VGELPLSAVIRWLVHERFGGYDAETSSPCPSQQMPPDCVAGAETYRAHLGRLPDEQVRMIFDGRIAELQSATEVAGEGESSLFFNRHRAFANYEYWGGHPLWSVEEATALTLSRDPRIVSWKAIKREAATTTAFANAYGRVSDLIRLHVEGRLLDLPIEPALYIDWCRSLKLAVPPGLVVAVGRHRGRKFEWQAGFLRLSELYQQSEEEAKAYAIAFSREVEEHKGSRRQLAALDGFVAETVNLQDAERAEHAAEIAALRREYAAELAALRSEMGALKSAAVDPRERDSMLKMIIGMAVAAYRFDPSARRSDRVPKLVGDLELNGVAVSDETARKYLRLGAALLPPEAREDVA